MLVHAHPDDETSQTGATLARYAAEGRVTLVTCTLGEAGDIVADDLSYLTAETLGEHRLGELHAAMADLGVTDYVRLGGDFAYRDSGMTTDEQGTVHPLDDLHPDCFWRADLLEAATHLVALIRDRRPQVLATYDTVGGYGHPDHVQAHRVAMYAYVLAGTASFRPDLGGAWTVSRVLWTAWDAASVPEMVAVADQLGLSELLTGWFDPGAELPPMFVPHEYIGARVHEQPWAAQVASALGRYRSQVDVDDPWWQFVKVAPDVPRYESFRLAAGVPFPPGEHPATDLFAGLSLDD